MTAGDQGPRARVPHGPLTPRERDIVRLVAIGLRNREIAARLAISEGTVEIHLNRIYDKTGAEGRVALTLWAQSYGLA